MNWTPDQMDRLERAIVDEDRVQITRRGTEYILIPLSVHTSGPDDILKAISTTGDEMEIRLEEVERFEVIR